MANLKKIEACSFKSEWNNPKGGVIYYHDVMLEGESQPYHIGATTKEPDFLKAGKMLNYDVTDDAKRKIKRVKEENGFQGGGAKPAYNSKGQAIGNALSNATLLICHGKADIKDLEKIAARYLEIANNLAAE